MGNYNSLTQGNIIYENFTCTNLWEINLGQPDSRKSNL